MEGKVLISLVGDPTNYKPAQYNYMGESQESTFSSIIVDKMESPTHKILIGQYTLGAERAGKERGESDFLYLQHLSERVIDEKLGLNDYQKIISPGVVFGNVNEVGFNYRGEIYNFYAYTLYRLARTFEEFKGDVQVILDLSHGINYMGYLTLSAVKLVLDVYSAFRKTWLKVINSDPYPPRWNGNSRPKLNINVVSEEQIHPSFQYPTGKGCVNSINPSNYLDNESKRRVGKLIRDSAKEKSVGNLESKQFVSSINNGTLLASYTFGEEFDRCVDFAVESFQDAVRIQSTNPLEAVQEVSFTPTFQSFVIAELLSRLGSMRKRAEVSLQELKERTCIYESHPMIYTIVNNEIHNIEEKIRNSNNQYSDWFPLSKVLGSKETPDKRVFFAHAGLPGGFVEFRNVNEIEIRYSWDKLDTVKNFLDKTDGN